MAMPEHKPENQGLVGSYSVDSYPNMATRPQERGVLIN